MSSAPQYRVEVWSGLGSGFSPGVLVADFQNAKNVGWAAYLNDVPEAFFTVNQDDKKISLLRSYRKTAHVKIYRNADLVFAGPMGEWQANETDVIVYAYGYLAKAYSLLSPWNVLYSSSQVDTIISAEWAAIKALTSSPLSWVTTGTVEAPVTLSGGSTKIVLPAYRIFYKRFLQTCRELAAFSIGDTNNAVVFEITPSGTFNFWKNKGVDTTTIWEWGDHAVAGFDDSNLPILRRNELLGVGHDANSGVLFADKLSSSDAAAVGLAQEPVFYAWVRDSVEMTRVTDHRAAAGLRDQQDLGIRLFANSVIPPGATGAAFNLADRVHVKIDRGLTSIDSMQMVTGVQTLFINHQERVRALVRSPLEP